MQENDASAIFPIRQKPQVAEYSLFKTYKTLLDKIEVAFNRSSPLFSLAVYNPLTITQEILKILRIMKMKKEGAEILFL